MAEEAPEGDYLEGARETIRGAAKWLVASFGAVGAVLVAGSQLSSIGELQTGSGRLQTAMLGVAIGLVAILGGTWVAVNLLLPVKWGLSELANRWTDAGARKGQGLGYWKRLRYGEIDFLARNPEYLGDFESPAEIRETYDRAEADDPDIEDLVH